VALATTANPAIRRALITPASQHGVIRPLRTATPARPHAAQPEAVAGTSAKQAAASIWHRLTA